MKEQGTVPFHVVDHIVDMIEQHGTQSAGFLKLARTESELEGTGQQLSLVSKVIPPAEAIRKAVSHAIAVKRIKQEWGIT